MASGSRHSLLLAPLWNFGWQRDQLTAVLSFLPDRLAWQMRTVLQHAESAAESRVQSLLRAAALRDGGGGDDEGPGLKFPRSMANDENLWSEEAEWGYMKVQFDPVTQVLLCIAG